MPRQMFVDALSGGPELLVVGKPVAVGVHDEMDKEEEVGLEVEAQALHLAANRLAELVDELLVVRVLLVDDEGVAARRTRLRSRVVRRVGARC